MKVMDVEIEFGTIRCECEDLSCQHGEQSCQYWAELVVEITGQGTWKLCPACVAQYVYLGY